MKEIKLIFNKTEIFDEVSLNSEYLGAKSDDAGGIYDRVATNPADEAILSRFFNEMYGCVTERLREFITGTTRDDNGFTLNLELSNAYDDTLTPGVREDLFGCIAKGVAARWLRLTSTDRATIWQSESDSLLARAFAKLCFRRRPTRNL